MACYLPDINPKEVGDWFLINDYEARNYFCLQLNQTKIHYSQMEEPNKVYRVTHRADCS